MSAQGHVTKQSPAATGTSSQLSEFRREPLFVLNRSYLATIICSVAFHAIILFVLASVMVEPDVEEEIFLFMSPFPRDPSSEVEPSSVDIVVQPETLIDGEVDDMKSSVDALLESDVASPTLADLSPDEIAASISMSEATSIVSTLAGQFGGRSEQGKLASLRMYGGTADSEKAVHSGLHWLASIQQEDGSWDYTRIGGAPNAGRLANGEMGATSMALLCFLGAGHTAGSGTNYNDTVRRGLKYLVDNARIINNEADLRGNVSGNGGMYIQGLATIALCEAHAMAKTRNRDMKVSRTAQAAIRFIQAAQDKNGGWRYQPRQPGDTSVVGWQIMAIKSGRAGQLRIDPNVMHSARRFLNSVQADGGAMYGYTGPAKRPGTTAIGLLCRMYMGWKRDREPLAKGVAYLSKKGPSRNDSYYNYYASQVLHHWGGDAWKKWNEELRPWLVESQAKDGPAAGSWRPVCKHASQGGRLYETAMSIMTLEVYYRHLPLYRRSAVTAKDETIGE